MNIVPTITAPGTAEFDINSEDNLFAGLNVADTEDDTLTIILEVEGFLSLGTLTGLTFLEGDGTDDSRLAFTGSVADINAALASLSYTPATDDVDGDTLQISVSDGQHFDTAPGTFPASIELSSLDGSTGFTLNGVAANDRAGYSVANAGDVNGDGVDDIIIGAYLSDVGGNNNAGTSYVVFGTTAGFASSFDLSSLNGTNGFAVTGISGADVTGIAVSSAGDINGDGFADVLIGGNGVNSAGNNDSGASYVVFGASGGFAASFSVSTLDSSNGFLIEGDASGDNLGRDVSAAGDINGDGYDDIIIGAYLADPNGNTSSGASYVLYGSGAAFGSFVNVSQLNSFNGFAINGVDANDSSGRSVDAAGDINGDGVDDLIIGAYYANPNGTIDAGETYIVFGQASGFGTSFELSSLNGTNGFAINGVDENDISGISVSGAGDVNGDGIDDVIIGASLNDADGNTNAGASYIVFGSTAGFSSSLELSALNGTNGFTIDGLFAGDGLGVSVSAAGDVNNDGIADLLVGANGVNSSAGATYVVLGQTGLGASGYFELSAIDGTNGFVLSGVDANDNAGWSVSRAGDVNGDGVEDILVGAYGGDPNGVNSAGETYVIYGTQTLTEQFVTDSVTIDLVNSLPEITAPTGLSFGYNTSANAIAGLSVSDVNDDELTIALSVEGALTFGTIAGLTFTLGDGADDDAMEFSGSVADINAALASLTYTPTTDDTDGDALNISVSDGSSLNDTPYAFELSDLDGANGFTIFGYETNSQAAWSVSSAGDFNNDGFEDLLIGAHRANSSDGKTFVVFGGSGLNPSGSFELSDLNGTNGFVITGVSGGGYYTGYSVSNAGDINGDGIDDIIIGAPSADSLGWNDYYNHGEAYVVFGSSSTGISGELNVTALNGSNGFKIEGINSYDSAAEAVSSAGDVNGDGYDDLIIGAPYGDPNGESSAGESYIVFGGTAVGSSGSIFLSTALDGSVGFVINGITTGDLTGSAVSGAGDLNGDGIDDFIIGADAVDPNGETSAGTSYVVFGTSTVGSSGSIDLSDLTGANGFILNGTDSYDWSGYTVALAGDLNGDGIDDVVIGAYGADPNGRSSAGESYVIFGSTDIGATGSLDLSDLNGTIGFVVNGAAYGDQSGISVSSAGDINGDGYDDLLIGANGTSAGTSYVIFGQASIGSEGTIDLLSLDRSTGFALVGVDSSEESGRSVSAAGDVDGDGIDDLLIGAPFARGSNNYLYAAGEAYVIYGATNISEMVLPTEVTIDLVNLPPELTAPGPLSFLADSSGNAISGISVSDPNGDELTVRLEVEGTLSLGTLTGLTFTEGDGTDDSLLVFSGSVADLNAALATLIYAPAAADPDGDTLNFKVSDFETIPGTFPASIDLSSLDGSNGFTLNGVAVGDRSGYSVSDAGDVNGDGIGDIIIGAYQANSVSPTNAGESYIVFGNSAGFSADFELSSLDGSNGFMVYGLASADVTGISVSGAGDVNGDGYDDVIIGGNGVDADGDSDAGTAYIVFGASGGFSASMSLSALNGSNGFSVDGHDPGDNLGRSVSSAGDINGDGIDDVIIGAYLDDPNGNGASGTSYVVFGSTAGFGANRNVFDLNGSNGFAIDGVSVDDRSGLPVASAGDINGDGVDDLFIGAHQGDPNGVSNAGEGYIVFGTTSGFSSRLQLSALDGSNGFTLNGESDSDFAGLSVNGAGDVNGDGIDDLIIGAFGHDVGGNANAGASYIVYGTTTGFATSFDLSSLNGTNGFRVEGLAAGDVIGGSVSSAGDINGDGVEDLLISANGANGTAGGAYVVFGGSAIGTSGSFELSTLDGTNGFALAGIAASDSAGYSVSAAGDVNGDGVDDLMLGAYGADPNGSESGETYVVYGSASIAEQYVTDSVAISLQEYLPEITVPTGLSFPVNSTGNAISGLSVDDQNGTDLTVRLSVEGTLTLGTLAGLTFSEGDGTNDALFTFTGSISDINAALATLTYTPTTDDEDGDTLNFAVSDSRHFTVSPGTFPASIELSALDGTDGCVINGIDATDQSGFAVSNAGDVNADGIDDFIVGAFRADGTGTTDAGETYVVFGTSSGFGSSFELSSLNGTNGFTLHGVADVDVSGSAVSAAGDFNGDGIDDFLVGGYGIDANGNASSGGSYVVFGSSNGFSSDLELSALNGSNGFAIDGIDADDNSGRYLSSAGDFNGDGFADIMIGADAADPNGTGQAGETYILFGTSSSFGASFDLSSLNGTNGFILNGFSADDRAGSSVSLAGDVNGDGIDDVIIGAYRADANGNSNSGQAYIVFGSTSGFSTQFELSSLNGTNGFSLKGNAVDDNAGITVAGIGDVNGDGFDDILVGASGVDANGLSNSGASYVVFGSSAGFASNIDLSALNGTNGFALNGVATEDRSGRQVSSAGDVNDDGIDDFLISAIWADPNGNSKAGATYLIFGSTALGSSANFDLSDLDGSNGFSLFGENVEDWAGWSVSAAGDVNDDGVDDLIVGTYSGGSNDAGLSYIVYGREDIQEDFVTDTVEIELIGQDLPTISAPGTQTFGTNSHNNLISGLSFDDINGDDLTITLQVEGALSLGFLTGLTFEIGDGTDDSEMRFTGSIADVNAAIATLRYSPANGDTDGDTLQIGVSDGEHFVQVPATEPANLQLSALNGTNGFAIEAEWPTSLGAGFSVSNAGDWNNDGVDDLIIGAPNAKGSTYGDQPGHSFIVFGTTAGFGSAFELSTLDGTNGLTLLGINDNDLAGYSVSDAGDVNGDGIDDVLVGAPTYSFGETYVVFGTTSPSASFELSSLNGANGFTLFGTSQYQNRSGWSVSSAGDVNGDGLDDILIGAWRASPNGTEAGEAYVVYGSSTFSSATFELSAIDGSNGFVIKGIGDYDHVGEYVSSAGDINGDGFDDVIVSSRYRTVQGNSGAGESYIVFGASSGFGSAFELSDLNGANGFTIYGNEALDRLGTSVSGAGDVNGDGIDDFIIGAEAANNYLGEVYVVFGNTAGFAARFSPTVLNGSNGFTINGIAAFDYVGVSVSSAGDINGDGIADILIGADETDSNGNSAAGSSYVVFGSSSGFESSFDLSALDGNNGFALHGIAEYDTVGRSVSAAGDVNGDGIDDIVIGSSAGEANGESYVIFGATNISEQFINLEEQFVTDTVTIDFVSGAQRDFDLSGTSDLLFQLPSQGNFFRLDSPDENALASNEGRPNSVSFGLADLDGDGTLDHILKAFNGAHVVQYGAENTGSQNIGRGNSVISGFADIDGDGEAEAFAQSLNPNVDRLFLLDDQFATITNLKVSDQTLKGFGDFDGDGVTDALIEASNGAKRIYSDADGMVLYGKRNNDSVAIGDFDGDGDDDLLTTRGGGNPFYILEGDDTSPFDTETSIGFGFHTAVAAGDFDGDGAKDVLIRENATDSWSILTLGLTSQSVLNLAAFEYEAIGDFNGDGEDDILFRLGNDNGRVYYSGDLSTFDTLTDMDGNDVRDIADYNGDGLDDILISDRSTGAFSILSGGTGAPIALDSSLNGASVVSANGIDTLGLIPSLLDVSSVSSMNLDPLETALSETDASDETARSQTGDIFVDGWA